MTQGIVLKGMPGVVCGGRENVDRERCKQRDTAAKEKQVYVRKSSWQNLINCWRKPFAENISKSVP